MNDTITVWVDNIAHAAIGDNRFPDLGQHWLEAEFNIFGAGNFSQAALDLGANLTVRTEVTSGNNATPTCDRTSWTGESNNLTLVQGSCVPVAGALPAIVFDENGYCPGPLRGTNVACLSLVAETASSRTFSLDGRQEGSPTPPPANVLLTWANGWSTGFYSNPKITLSETDNPNNIAYNITFDSIYKTTTTLQLAAIRLRDINNNLIMGFTNVSHGFLPIPKCPGPFTIPPLQGVLAASGIANIAYVDIDIFPPQGGGENCV
jgi:hypothetical protein